jgi:hypothetical protein
MSDRSGQQCKRDHYLVVTEVREKLAVSKQTTQRVLMGPVYFSHRIRLLEAHHTLNGRNILFANHVIYLGVIFTKRNTWRLYPK